MKFICPSIGQTGPRRKTTHNDSEREMWVMNDEALYDWHRHSKLSMRNFLRQNRAEIDAHIDSVLNKEPRS